MYTDIEVEKSKVQDGRETQEGGDMGIYVYI